MQHHLNQSHKRFKTPEDWFLDWLNQPYFADIARLFDWAGVTRFPDVQLLNHWCHQSTINDIEFVCDEVVQMEAEQPASDLAGLYYEQIIALTKQVPTRKDNWHDLFNALIWMLFPATKRYLNQLHMQEIERHGLHPRTPLRNRVTHFDECGGILVYQDEHHLQALQNHQWHASFVTLRAQWQHSTRFFVFGHANYEMLLNPYIGLTGKYIPLKVEDDFWGQSLLAQYRWLDSVLPEMLDKQQWFTQKLKPLPLLGIPGWHPENDHPQFYANTDYFRPLRSATRK